MPGIEFAPFRILPQIRRGGERRNDFEREMPRLETGRKPGVFAGDSHPEFAHQDPPGRRVGSQFGAGSAFLPELLRIPSKQVGNPGFPERQVVEWLAGSGPRRPALL